MINYEQEKFCAKECVLLHIIAYWFTLFTMDNVVELSQVLRKHFFSQLMIRM